MQSRDRKGVESKHPSLTVGARKFTWDPENKDSLFGLVRELRLRELRETSSSSVPDLPLLASLVWAAEVAEAI
jgi:hypothetical protein